MVEDEGIVQNKFEDRSDIKVVDLTLIRFLRGMIVNTWT